MIATETRLQAIARLAELSGDQGIDTRLVLARPNSIDLIYRRALRASIGDELLLGEVRALHDVARGRATPLVDAVADGLPQQTLARAQMPSLEEFDRIVAEELA